MSIEDPTECELPQRPRESTLRLVNQVKKSAASCGTALAWRCIASTSVEPAASAAAA